jgi:hypothetical protein
VPAFPGTFCGKLNASPEGKNPKFPGICGVPGGLGFVIVLFDDVLFFAFTNLKEFLSNSVCVEFSNGIKTKSDSVVVMNFCVVRVVGMVVIVVGLCVVGLEVVVVIFDVVLEFSIDFLLTFGLELAEIVCLTIGFLLVVVSGVVNVVLSVVSFTSKNCVVGDIVVVGVVGIGVVIVSGKVNFLLILCLV